MHRVRLTVNGMARDVAVRSDELLLDTLREQIGCSSVREGCGVGLCGACTAIVDGRPATACLTLTARCDGAEVLTTEGLAPDDPVVAAFVEQGAMQCGYCTPAFVLMARDLLRHDPAPSAEQIDEHLAGNICRCGSYLEIRKAVAEAARASNGESHHG